jgi:adenylate cyclase
VAETRTLAAILAADVVGFSRRAGADEDRTWARLRALRSDLIEPTIAIHHGRVVKRTGDGLIVEFRSVVVAVRCAIEVQDSVERNAGPPPERRIEFRVGIHSATSSRRATAISWATGQHRRTARRHCSPGDVCLSEDAYRQVKARLDLAVSDLGPIQLKNIAEPIRSIRCKSRLRRQRGLRRRPRPKKPPRHASRLWCCDSPTWAPSTELQRA